MELGRNLQADRIYRIHDKIQFLGIYYIDKVVF